MPIKVRDNINTAIKWAEGFNFAYMFSYASVIESSYEFRGLLSIDRASKSQIISNV